MEQLFGKCYETVGNIESDLLLKTRSEVKIQIGNQFLDFSAKINDLSSKIESLTTRIEQLESKK